MPLLQPETKRALRRLQADKLMTKKQLAEYIGVSEQTAQTLTKNDEPYNVKMTVYEKVMTALSKSY